MSGLGNRDVAKTRLFVKFVLAATLLSLLLFSLFCESAALVWLPLRNKLSWKVKSCTVLLVLGKKS